MQAYPSDEVLLLGAIELWDLVLCVSDSDIRGINVGFLVQNANCSKFNLKSLLFIADLYICFVGRSFKWEMDTQKALYDTNNLVFALNQERSV